MQEEGQARQILQGPFTYFRRGLQTFAFLSADGNYVLKIFNNAPKRKMERLRLLPFSWARKKAAFFEEKYAKWFASAKVAFEEMREETGLIFHLEETDGSFSKTLLIDRLQIAHPIDLDKAAFVLQKKATLAYPALLAMRAKGEHELARCAIENLLLLIEKRFAKGISDSDPLIRTNFGFIEKTPIQIDIGPFEKDASVQDPLFFIVECVALRKV